MTKQPMTKHLMKISIKGFKTLVQEMSDQEVMMSFEKSGFDFGEDKLTLDYLLKETEGLDYAIGFFDKNSIFTDRPRVAWEKLGDFFSETQGGTNSLDCCCLNRLSKSELGLQIWEHKFYASRNPSFLFFVKNDKF